MEEEVVVKEECNCATPCKDGEQCECEEKSTCKNHDKERQKKKEKYKKEIEELKGKLLEKEKELSEKDAKIKYSQAELVNYRKRKEEEVENRLKYANQDLINEIIPILDNFERAIKLDDNDLSDELSKFLTGFKMMYATLSEVLKKFGVEEINCKGEIFNPNKMQALMTENDGSFQDDEVIEVLLKGYELKGRVIRPASVKVNKLDKEGDDKNE